VTDRKEKKLTVFKKDLLFFASFLLSFQEKFLFRGSLTHGDRGVVVVSRVWCGCGIEGMVWLWYRGYGVVMGSRVHYAISLIYHRV
jgi:hypothetical protein